jgi:pimeloyl-ACP methyl ester carboxylesterase
MLGYPWKSSVQLDPEARAEYVAAYSDPVRVRAMLGYYRGVARPRARAAIGLGPQPTYPAVHAEKMLVLWGAADPVLPVRTGEGIVKDLGPECAMVTVPGAGHYVVEEAPDVVLATLRDFLA